MYMCIRYHRAAHEEQEIEELALSENAVPERYDVGQRELL